MYLKKINEKNFENNDVYLLENYKENIIVNNNYEGILLLDDNFTKLKNIFITKDLIIQYIFKKFNNTALLLYIEEHNSLIYINLITYENYIISLDKKFNDKIFSTIYFWENDDNVILTTYDDECYKLSLNNNQIQEISKEKLKEICPFFYTYWQKSKKLIILKSYPQRSELIIENNKSKIIELFNTEKNLSLASIHKPNYETHDIEAINTTFLLLSCFECNKNQSGKIEIIDKNHHANQSIVKPYQYSKAKFLNSNTFVALISNYHNKYESKLIKYEIINE